MLGQHSSAIRVPVAETCLGVLQGELGSAVLSSGDVAEVAGVAAVIDLPELGGSAALRAADLNVRTLCAFSEHE